MCIPICVCAYVSRVEFAGDIYIIFTPKKIHTRRSMSYTWTNVLQKITQILEPRELNNRDLYQIVKRRGKLEKIQKTSRAWTQISENSWKDSTLFRPSFGRIFHVYFYIHISVVKYTKTRKDTENNKSMDKIHGNVDKYSTSIRTFRNRLTEFISVAPFPLGFNNQNS